MNNVGRIIRFDDLDYIVLSRIVFNLKSYLYLMSLDRPLKVLIAQEFPHDSKLIELDEVTNEDEKSKIYNLFLENANKMGV